MTFYPGGSFLSPSSKDYYSPEWPKVQKRNIRAERNWKRFVWSCEAVLIVLVAIGFLQVVGWVWGLVR